MYTDQEPTLSERRASALDDHIPPVAVGYRSRLPAGGLILPHAPAGGLVRVLPKLTYAFQPDIGVTETIVLAKYVDVCWWVSGALLVRVHASNLIAEQLFQIDVRRASFAEEDPAADLLVSSPLIASVAFDTTTTAPVLLSDDFAPPLSSDVQVILSAIQHPERNDPMSCTIGVDLVGRPA